MNKWLLVFFIILFLPAQLFAAGYRAGTDPRLQLLKQQVIKDILASRANEQEALRFTALMKDDGSWPDIDYADKTRGGWPVNDHLLRLNNMTIAYKTTGGRLAG